MIELKTSPKPHHTMVGNTDGLGDTRHPRDLLLCSSRDDINQSRNLLRIQGSSNITHRKIRDCHGQGINVVEYKQKPRQRHVNNPEMTGPRIATFPGCFGVSVRGRIKLLALQVRTHKWMKLRLLIYKKNSKKNRSYKMSES